MDTFNLISGICSILSLLISIFIASKVIKININNSHSSKSKVKGSNNLTAGRDLTTVPAPKEVDNR